MTLPTNYQDAVVPTGGLTEWPATTSRGINAFSAQINANTAAIAGLASVINVKASPYNAVGDGVANDTTAIAAALTAAQVANKSLFFPPGTYLTGDIYDGTNIDWIGAGYPLSIIKARTGSTTLLSTTNGTTGGTAAAKRISGLTLDGAGISNTCLNTAYPSTGPSIRHHFYDLYIKSYQTIGWIGDNNNDAYFTNITVAKHTDTPGTAIAARFHASGGGISFNNCVFVLPIQLSCQNATIRDGYNFGIVFDAGGVNLLSAHNGYLYANPVTHNNIDINSGISTFGMALFGMHIENAYNDGYIFGGAGNLTNVNAVGGHWSGVPGTTPSPKIAANTLSSGQLAGLVDMSGTFVENLNLADASNVKVIPRNVDNQGLYQSTTRILNTSAGTEIYLGTHMVYIGNGVAIDSYLSGTGDWVVAGSISGESAPRIYIQADGKVVWGPGNAVADTNLYRNSANELKTDDALTIVGLLLTAASATGNAGIRLPHGAAPTAPVNGDMWTTTAGLFVRINGVTKTVTLT